PVGSRVKGKVVAILKYGAFIELEPGIEGLVHISEMSWTQHIRHPSQLISVGDEIEVIVLSIDKENHKISLGMKQVEEDPWERVENTYLPGTRHKCVVKELVPFGAFVELEPGVEGLIHISDLSWTRKVRHPGEIVKKGQEIEAVILSFDRNERRISLGLKQLEEDPWGRFEEQFPVHSRTEGTVVRILERGVVVALPAGVEGFVPNSHLGKTYSGEGKRELREGDRLELEVIEFDRNSRRIVLSHLVVERAKEKEAYEEYLSSLQETKVSVGELLRVREDSDAITDVPGAEPIRLTKKKKTSKKTDEELTTEEKSAPLPMSEEAPIDTTTTESVGYSPEHSVEIEQDIPEQASPENRINLKEETSEDLTKEQEDKEITK
ncbi:MAG: S1 RNA-binding domain-containing protein, partial [bacterium]